MSNKDTNPFDELTIENAQKTAENDQKGSEKHQKIDYLIHRVFYQNEAGQELLEIWKQTTLMSCSAIPGDQLLDIGLAEGKKEFVRSIIKTIEGVNNG